MKYIVVIPDGAADRPSDALGGRTALEAASTPVLDAMTREGSLGLAATVPAGMQPGSDVANMSLLGYDPAKELTGRAALEAASMGVEVPVGDAVFRANLVTISPDGLMEDYSAGHIGSEEAAELVNLLNRDLEIDGVKLFPGVGYRHLCLMEAAGTSLTDCAPPHEIMGEPIDEHLPRGQFSSWVLEVERTSRNLLPAYEVNRQRVARGAKPANSLWLWGWATAMKLEPFAKRFGIGSAGLISAVDLMRGIGKLAGMDVLDVEGATAYYDTNYAGKGRAALDYIYGHDLVVVHVEAPDEAGHNADLAEKVRAIENIDRHILAPIYAMAKHYGDWRILVSPDHPTPVSTRKHHDDPVPYVMWGAGVTANGAEHFGEREAARVGGGVSAGKDLVLRLTQL